MLPQLTNIPTDSLNELLSIIITGETCTAKDMLEIHQIRNELRRRGERRFLKLVPE